MKPLEHWHQLRGEWAVQTLYQRFESLVALALTALISLVIVVALYQLAHGVIIGLVGGALDPLDHRAFQKVFGDILTLLIALEFNHTLQYVVTRQQSIIQTKVVLLIALLALARKFIVLDVRETTAQQLFGLAAVMLVIGLTYWLMRERDERTHRVSR